MTAQTGTNLRVMDELKANPNRSGKAIAYAAGVGTNRVAQVARSMGISFGRGLQRPRDGSRVIASRISKENLDWLAAQACDPEAIPTLINAIVTDARLESE
ncbi:MAG: hypothetical protein AAGF20_07510 [Pseudomonadota bacterium]